MWGEDMKRIGVGVFIVLAVAAQAKTQPSATTRVSPLFSRLEDGPTFMLECTNTSSVPLDPIDESGNEAIRLDGRVSLHEGGVGGSHIIGQPKVAPNASWRKVFPLVQPNSHSTGTGTLGASLRGGWFMPLSAGRHTLAIRCAGTWSNEVDFYWDDQPPQ
jgi:hypothetical protein